MTPHVRPILRRALTLMMMVTALAGCTSGSVSDPGGAGTSSDPFTAAQALWTAKKPAGDRYVMVQRVVCFCTLGNVAYRVTVVGNTITAIVNDKTDAPLATSSWGAFRTVTQLFDAVRTALTKTGTLKIVEYDPSLGFPRTLSLDPILNAVDDEVSYVTTSVSAPQ